MTASKSILTAMILGLAGGASCATIETNTPIDMILSIPPQ